MFVTFGKTWRVAAAALLVIGAISSVSYAQQSGPGAGLGPMGRQGRGMGRAAGPGARLGLPLGQLNLTDDQRAQIRAIVQSHNEEMRQLGDRTRVARRALARQATPKPSTSPPFARRALN